MPCENRPDTWDSKLVRNNGLWKEWENDRIGNWDWTFAPVVINVGRTNKSLTGSLLLIYDCQVLSLEWQSCSRMQRSHLGLRAIQTWRP